MRFPMVWSGLLAFCALPLAAVTLYPAAGGSNLRVPVIAPVPGGARGNAVDFEGVQFTYELQPHFQAAESGELEFFLRDLPRRREKSVLVLTGADGSCIELRVEPASAGRTFSLRGNGRKVTSAEQPEIGRWRRYQLALRPGKALFQGSGKSITLPLPAGFQPVRLTVYAAMTDELRYRSGGAELTLDWEKDYAARVKPAKNSGGVSTSLHGFDSFAVSTDPKRRDCPTLQLVNSTGSARKIQLDYTIKSERRRLNQHWKQQITLAPGEEKIEAVRFPFPLATDLYHLELKVTGSDTGKQFRRHFFHVEPRGEKSGPGLFGLHDCDVNVFGFWPDALPLRFSHKYLRWGYVVGPAWLRDFHGNYGLDPDTPPAEWNWNEKLDWELASGREMYVCLQSTPLSDWQRERPYSKMRKLAWGWSGGFPKLDRYAEFVRAAGERYKGKIRLWEVENEPNASSHMPDKPGDYAAICKTVSAVLKPIDRANVIFGISGTSTFVPWMKKVLALGGYPALDAISWHTYTTPEQPDKAGLPAMLREARETAAQYRRFFNSETGVLTAFRYEADQPIPPEVVAEKVAARATGFVSKNAWPGRVNDEYLSSMSIVKNAAINFLAGVEAFVFFGWNPKWPADPAKWEQNTPSFSLISATTGGERTPNLVTLAIGVLAAQFEGVVLNPPPGDAAEHRRSGGVDSGAVDLLSRPRRGTASAEPRRRRAQRHGSSFQAGIRPPARIRLTHRRRKQFSGGVATEFRRRTPDVFGSPCRNGCNQKIHEILPGNTSRHVPAKAAGFELRGGSFHSPSFPPEKLQERLDKTIISGGKYELRNYPTTIIAAVSIAVFSAQTVSEENSPAPESTLRPPACNGTHDVAGVQIDAARTQAETDAGCRTRRRSELTSTTLRPPPPPDRKMRRGARGLSPLHGAD